MARHSSPKPPPRAALPIRLKNLRKHRSNGSLTQTRRSPSPQLNREYNKDWGCNLMAPVHAIFRRLNKKPLSEAEKRERAAFERARARGSGLKIKITGGGNGFDEEDLSSTANLHTPSTIDEDVPSLPTAQPSKNSPAASLKANSRRSSISSIYERPPTPTKRIRVRRYQAPDRVEILIERDPWARIGKRIAVRKEREERHRRNFKALTKTVQISSSPYRHAIAPNPDGRPVSICSSQMTEILEYEPDVTIQKAIEEYEATNPGICTEAIIARAHDELVVTKNAERLRKIEKSMEALKDIGGYLEKVKNEKDFLSPKDEQTAADGDAGSSGTSTYKSARETQSNRTSLAIESSLKKENMASNNEDRSSEEPDKIAMPKRRSVQSPTIRHVTEDGVGRSNTVRSSPRKSRIPLPQNPTSPVGGALSELADIAADRRASTNSGRPESAMSHRTPSRRLVSRGGLQQGTERPLFPYAQRQQQQRRSISSSVEPPSRNASTQSRNTSIAMRGRGRDRGLIPSNSSGQAIRSPLPNARDNRSVTPTASRGNNQTIRRTRPIPAQGEIGRYYTMVQLPEEAKRGPGRPPKARPTSFLEEVDLEARRAAEEVKNKRYSSGARKVTFDIAPNKEVEEKEADSDEENTLPRSTSGQLKDHSDETSSGNERKKKLPKTNYGFLFKKPGHSPGPTPYFERTPHLNSKYYISNPETRNERPLSPNIIRTVDSTPPRKLRHAKHPHSPDLRAVARASRESSPAESATVGMSSPSYKSRESRKKTIMSTSVSAKSFASNTSTTAVYNYDMRTPSPSQNIVEDEGEEANDEDTSSKKTRTPFTPYEIPDTIKEKFPIAADYWREYNEKKKKKREEEKAKAAAEKKYIDGVSEEFDDELGD